MGEIRIVGPGKTRGYPYPVCKNPRALLRNVQDLYWIPRAWFVGLYSDNPLAKAQGLSLRTGTQTMLYLSLFFSSAGSVHADEGVFDSLHHVRLEVWPRDQGQERVEAVGKELKVRKVCLY